jgi:hypothetical protein
MGCSEFNFLSGICQDVKKDFDYTRVFQYKDPDGNAIDLTGSDLNMTIKDTLGGTTLLSLAIVGSSSATGFYIPTPTDGTINMFITQADVTSVPAGDYVHEIIITNSAGKDEIFMQGTIQFTDRGF